MVADSEAIAAGHLNVGSQMGALQGFRHLDGLLELATASSCRSMGLRQTDVLTATGKARWRVSHSGNHEDASQVLGSWYGGFFGAFVTHLAYVLLVREIRFQRALWPSVVGTLVGEFAGAVLGPAPLAVVTGWILHWSLLGQNPHAQPPFQAKISFTLSRTCWLCDGFRYRIVLSMSE